MGQRKFDLENYIPVSERITQFWKNDFEVNVDGRIETEILHLDEPDVNHRMVVVKASIFIPAEAEHPIATGLAKEREGLAGANQTAFIENAETSAIGRALANLGVLTERARPSREEMEAVSAIQEHHDSVLSLIKTLALQSQDEEIQKRVKNKWKELKTDPTQASLFLTALKTQLEIEDEELLEEEEEEN